MQNSNSVRLGAEYTLHLSALDLIGRAGVSYETSAIPTNYVSPLTIDNDKVIASVGGGLLVMNKKLRLDAAVSHTFQNDVNVPYDTAAVPLINPVKGNATPPDPVNGGVYHVDVWIVSAGLAYQF